jgi:hypothetical protein
MRPVITIQESPETFLRACAAGRLIRARCKSCGWRWPTLEEQLAALGAAERRFRSQCYLDVLRALRMGGALSAEDEALFRDLDQHLVARRAGR